MAAFLLAVHGGPARTLREDFCGTGGVCRAWVALRGAGRRPFRAIGVDKDHEPLARLRAVPRVRAVHADVMRCALKADIISATNFPIGYWHTRRELLAYLRASRLRLNRGGVFVCDTYGGATAFTPGTLTRDVWPQAPALRGVRIRYTWQQREADPLTGLVEDALHFRADRGGEVIYQENDAFVYHWRLWSITELRDAMAQAGFRSSEVYAKIADAIDDRGGRYIRPVESPDELDESYVVLIAAR
jgi:SAM-dependent methyltransferase